MRELVFSALVRENATENLIHGTCEKNRYLLHNPYYLAVPFCPTFSYDAAYRVDFGGASGGGGGIYRYNNICIIDGDEESSYKYPESLHRLIFV